VGGREGGREAGKGEGREDFEDWLAGNPIVWERVVGLVHGPKDWSRYPVSLAVAAV